MNQKKSCRPNFQFKGRTLFTGMILSVQHLSLCSRSHWAHAFTLVGISLFHPIMGWVTVKSENWSKLTDFCLLYQQQQRKLGCNKDIRKYNQEITELYTKSWHFFACNRELLKKAPHLTTLRFFMPPLYLWVGGATAAWQSIYLAEILQGKGQHSHHGSLEVATPV